MDSRELSAAESTIGSSPPLAPRPARLSPTIRILLAMVLGIITGLVLGPRVSGIGELGKLMISLIKMLAGPLVFFAVVDAFLRTRVKIRNGLTMVTISAVNATLAIIIGLGLSNLLKPGTLVPMSITDEASAEFAKNARPIKILDELIALVPTNLIEPFRTNSIFSIVVLAVLGGMALRRLKDEQLAAGKTAYRTIEDVVAGGLRAVEILLGWIVVFLPLAVFAVMAQTVGTQGIGELRGLAVYIAVVVLGLALHVGVIYQGWVALVAGLPLKRFWAGVRDPVAYAAGASSSLATLPVTLRSLRSMGVSDEAARMSACVGTNLNNDGILLYEAMAALYVAQTYGIELSLVQQLLVAATCVLAGVGIAGVPEAGLISLALVLTTAGLPLAILPLLLSVDWILSRCRAMTNVISDMLVAILIDHFAKVKAEPGGGDEASVIGGGGADQD
jgi:Na+/H+-dicarboxylate symporter